MTSATRDDRPIQSLKERILRASSWTMLAYTGTLVLRLASSLIMTRLLAPEAFGLIALVATVTMVATLLSDIGIRQAVVQNARGDDPLMLNTAWTMQIGRGVAIWIVCALIALGLYFANRWGWLAVGSVYAHPDLPLVLALGSFQVVFAGFETTKRFSADRTLELKRVALIELSSMAAGLAATVALGWFTRSVWAIVFGGWVMTVMSVIAAHLWLHGHPNRFQWERERAREIFHFGKWILASSLLWVLAYNGDKLLLGLWVDPTQLGFYSIALNLAMLLEQAAGRVFGQVAPPALGDVVRNSPERLRETYLRMRLPFDVVLVVAAGFMFAVGQWLVNLMYDPRYAPAGQILQILSFGLVFSRFNFVASAYLALQKPKVMSIVNLAKVISFFVVLPLAYSLFGVTGAYWAIALHLIPVVPLVWWFNHRHGLHSWRHELLTLLLWPVGWLGGLAFVAVASRLN